MQKNSNSTNPIVFENVSKQYTGHTEPILHNISFQIPLGSFTCLVGPSGSGKSTILKLITGLEVPTNGTVITPKDIGMVFQNGALLPWKNVAENAAFGLDPRKYSKQSELNHVLPYLELIGLESFAFKYPRELSGGERQRVGIARALAIKPEVLILDEPFSALDIQTTEALHRDILEIWRKTGMTVVMVSHSIEEAVTLADDVYLLQNGKIKNDFHIEIDRPRRAQDTAFTQEVNRIRKAFLQ